MAKSPARRGPHAITQRALSGALRRLESGGDPKATAAGLGLTPAAFEALRAKAVERRRAKLVGRLPLAFHKDDPAAESAIHEDISALVPTGDGESLWIGADEGASLERLTAERDAEGRITGYGAHRRFDLHELFEFPNGRDEEADVEGLAVADGYLWIVGSHSLKRKKPDPAADEPEEALEKLTRVIRETNRFFLGRAPLAAGDTPGGQTLAATAPPLEPSGRKRRAGALKFGKHGNVLSALLRKDVHLGPFMAIPSKDNGLDVEGLAVSGDRVFLGLRGPVLRGWAVVIEIAVEATRKGRLKLARLADGERYAKHFLDLDGLGIRSLRVDGSDLVLLAGPTMDLDGPVRLYRWRDALGAHESAVTPQEEVERVLELPFGEGDDHAEGATMMRLSPGEPLRLVIAYDSPARARLLPGGRGAMADVFEAPERG